MRLKVKINGFLAVLKKSFLLLISTNPILLTAATAFFTTFALSPLIIILSLLLKIFFNQDVILPQFYSKIALAVGERTATDIKRIVDGFLSLETSTWWSIFLTLFFYFVGTTLLSAIRQSIHQLWEIRKKPARKANYQLKERAIEVGMIVLIAALFLMAVLTDEGLVFLREGVPFANHILFRISDIFFSILIISLWFVFLFKLMPEAKVSWRVGVGGGLLTGVLFVGGRVMLTKIFVWERVEKIFGPSASMAIVLLFIFYCSFILYFGAAFTIEYGKFIGRPVKPGTLGEFESARPDRRKS